MAKDLFFLKKKLLKICICQKICLYLQCQFKLNNTNNRVMKHVWNFSPILDTLSTKEDINIIHKETKPFELMERLNNNGKLTKEEKEWICRESMNATCVKNQVCQLGWAYDFRPFMKRYLINYYGQWLEKYAFSKKELQKVMRYYKGEIVEAHNKYKI